MKKYHAITLGIIRVNFFAMLTTNVVSAAPENNFEIQGMRVQISGSGATENAVRNVRDRLEGPWLNHLLDHKRRMNQIDATSQAEICPVCLEEMQGKDLMLTPCNHVFCSPCITQVLDNQHKCPTCRQRLGNSNQLQPLRYTPGEEVELAVEIAETVPVQPAVRWIDGVRWHIYEGDEDFVDAQAQESSRPAPSGVDSHHSSHGE